MPDVDTTTAMSSSISSPTRSDVDEQLGLAFVVRGDRQHGRLLPVEHPLQRGQK